MYSILHETGHGLYEQGLPVEHFGTPAGTAVSMGIHESQSRLWENHVGRSRSFWEYWHPIACEYFPSVKQLTPGTSLPVGEPGPAVVYSDRCGSGTYDLHIMLRFDVEVKLVTRHWKWRTCRHIGTNSLSRCRD